MAEKKFFGLPAGYSSDEESEASYDGNFEAWYESELGAQIKRALQAAMRAARGDLSDPSIVGHCPSPRTPEGHCVLNEEGDIVGPSYIIRIAPVSKYFVITSLFAFAILIFLKCKIIEFLSISSFVFCFSYPALVLLHPMLMGPRRLPRIRAFSRRPRQNPPLRRTKLLIRLLT